MDNSYHLKKRSKIMSENQKVTIALPKEEYELIELKGNNLPAICLVNKSLVEFK